MTTKPARRWTECKFTQWFCKCIEQCNAVTFAMVASPMQRVGLPDRYVCHTLFRGWLEFKSHNGRLSPIQRKVLTDLRTRGDNCFVVRYRTDNTFEINTIDEVTLVVVDLLALVGGGPLAGTTILLALNKALHTKVLDNCPVHSA